MVGILYATCEDGGSVLSRLAEGAWTGVKLRAEIHGLVGALAGAGASLQKTTIGDPDER